MGVLPMVLMTTPGSWHRSWECACKFCWLWCFTGCHGAYL